MFLAKKIFSQKVEFIVCEPYHNRSATWLPQPLQRGSILSEDVTNGSISVM